MRKIRQSELAELAGRTFFTIDEGEAAEYMELTEFVTETIGSLESLPPPDPRRDNAAASRDPGRRPRDGEDPYNAVVRWCSVRPERAEGPLAGWRVGVKDSVAVAGIPLTCGSPVLEGFVPSTDSVVARRILEAGAEIVASLNMDAFAFSGGGDSSGHGPTWCPFDPTRTAAGSSGGSGAALHYDDVDVTIGCDQGGSIRAPAAWCGVVGLKPTYGLVPYTGILAIDGPIDHTGPMARTAGEAARLLAVIAGKDPDDPRQLATVPSADYVGAVEAAGEDLSGLRIGVVEEGFAGVEAEPAVVEATRGAVARLAAMGASVREVSVPEHLRGGGISFTAFIEGYAALLRAGGNGFGWNGRYSPELARALAQGLRAHAEELSPQVKLALICGEHLRAEYGGEYYARGYNQRAWLRAAYDRALADVDVLIMPTTPGLPHRHDPELGIAAHVLRGWAVLSNTAPFDMTGHPAINLPAAEADGLPVGVMAIGRHFEDDRLLALARSYEAAHGWSPAPPPDRREARWHQAPAAPESDLQAPEKEKV